MQTNRSYHHLAPRKVTLSLHGVQIFLLNYEMELALEVAVLLGGSQWCVAVFITHILV